MNLQKIDRRSFVRLAAAASVATATPSLFAQKDPFATFRFTRTPLARMPLDFTGLSYESPQLVNPAFFSPANSALVKLYRELTPNGVLRTGGNLSAFTAWRDDPSIPLTPAEKAAADQGKQYWEWDLTDPSVRSGDRVAVFTPASIQALAAFLEATNWKLIYGLNFATGTPAQAAAEAACVQRLVGDRLIGFQLGNELDFWSGGFRPRTWNFDTFYAEWSEWVRLIRARVPNAPFCGPDVAVRLDWMEQMAARQPKGLALLSKHHYAMGPAGDPRMDGKHLLGPDPDVAKEIASAQKATAVADVRFRNTECNSCYHGGQPGVSNAYASALWCADYMLTLAAGGHAGVNLHGGGNGFYSPIVGDTTSGITALPIYHGMQFAQAFAGSTLVESTLSTNGIRANAFAAETKDGMLLAFINKDSVPVTISIAPKSLAGFSLEGLSQLSAPALDSMTGVRFAEFPPAGAMQSALKEGHIPVAPYTGLLLRLRS